MTTLSLKDKILLGTAGSCIPIVLSVVNSDNVVLGSIFGWAWQAWIASILKFSSVVFCGIFILWFLGDETDRRRAIVLAASAPVLMGDIFVTAKGLPIPRPQIEFVPASLKNQAWANGTIQIAVVDCLNRPSSRMQITNGFFGRPATDGSVWVLGDFTSPTEDREMAVRRAVQYREIASGVSVIRNLDGKYISLLANPISENSFYRLQDDIQAKFREHTNGFLGMPLYQAFRQDHNIGNTGYRFQLIQGSRLSSDWNLNNQMINDLRVRFCV